MVRKFSVRERDYWASVCIACSQVSFGALWATIFIAPIDGYKIIVLVLNAFTSVAFWITGRRLITK